jgi:DMSO/TMAO reductase YedYZ molybdopterin-dependent catalytic subunit
MEQASPTVGALFGGVAMLPALAVSYLGHVLATLPFLPYSLFDWLARVLPGNVVTAGIDSIVALMGAVGIPTSSAKRVEQLLAIVLVLTIGAVVGSIVAAVRATPAKSERRVSLLAGGVLAALFVVVEGMLPSGPGFVTAVLWHGVVLVAWGFALGSFLASYRVTATASSERRSFLVRAAVAAVAVATGGWVTGWLFGREEGPQEAGQPVAQIPEDESLLPTPEGRITPVAGTRAEVSSNDDFYRIDINSIPPVIDGAEWNLATTGLFRNPRALTINDVLAFPSVTQPITLSCISNRIGGDLIGTSYWTGARLRDVVEELGLQPEAGALYLEAEDGFYETVVAADIMDERTLLVYAMNGETLPIEHGFPLRIYIPDRYGMKQPKWIVRMEAVEAWRPGYWVDRGWSREARPHIVSVIDTASRDGEMAAAGGIAWAGARGISKVEVRVDEGSWEEAQLRTPPLSGLTWVQWRYDWPIRGSGRYTLTVKATDGNGELQTAEEQSVRPDGATGYHSLTTRL